MPLRIAGSSGRQGTVASVDSELSLLYRRLVGPRVALVGAIANPYFAAPRPLAEAKPFTRADHDIYLVARLDGFDQADAVALIDRGAAPRSNGRFLLDAKGGSPSNVADRWLQASATALAQAGYQDRVVLESGAATLRAAGDVLGYASWGSNDAAIRSRRLGLRFVPGALAMLLVSSDARTLQAPPETWQPGGAPFAGTAQSLTGDLIREGVTGVSGSVAEPFLDGTLRPDILFPAYVAGFNLVESFYLATPYLSWQSVVFGDPLCGPFAAKRPPFPSTASELDAETELPVNFSRRRVEFLSSTGVDPAVAKLLLKGEARLRHADADGARQAFEAALALDPRLVGARRSLAAIHDSRGEHDLAIEQYRRVLAIVPDDLLSLNNLAYALAVHKKQPADALRFGQQAYATSKGQIASIADTLGWIHYLLGNQAEAEKILVDAAARAPDNAEIQLHLAHVYVALGRRDAARRAIANGLRINVALTDREDVKALRARLGAG